ncbi:UBP12 (YJL197W) [Zygosaccharomyces parabailii]|nr:UBP12 (YJL197W) [Zygosaccharomyces parabailii]
MSDSSGGELSTENEPVDVPDKEGLDNDIFPSLDKQRNIITQLLNTNQKQAKEGDRVYIIPQFWYAKFLDPQTVESKQLGPIDTSTICRDYDNFILVDYEQCPYLSLPESVFVKLIEWYGLAINSQPVCTSLILDENNNLVTEYNRCVFRVHHLVASNYERRYNNRKVAYFAISKLSTLKQLSIKILDTFFDRETELDISKAKFKIWFVKDSDANSATSVLNSSYLLDPLQFMSFPVHTRITPQLFARTLKDTGIFTGDFVVELRQSNQNYHWISNYFMYNELAPSNGTTGLSNLGNTCYMNSALQCLVHIPELRDYFLYGGYEREINTENPLGYQGYIARAFSLLIQNLFGRRASISVNPTVSTACSPTNFKNTIGHFNSMFAGYMQQDSQEFITFLLDGLHEDLNRIVKKPYVEKPSLSPEDNKNDFNVIKKLAEDTWKLHLLRNDSIITDLFVGLYESTLQCPECNNISITFDPYNDLTLPLPVNTVWHCKVKVFPQNSPPCILEVEMSKSSTYQDLKEYVSRYAEIDSHNLYGCEIFSHQFYNNYESPESNSQFLPIQELISESDDVIFYEIQASEDDIIVPVLNSRIEEGFKSPRLFGVPFFIVLSPLDRTNPGAVRYTIENYYSHLSGGFVEFPLQRSDELSSSSTLTFLSERYPNVNFDEIKDILEYVIRKGIESVDCYFKIKIIENSSSEGETDREFLSDAEKPEPEFWTPFSPVNLNKSKDISEFLDPVIKNIYEYPASFHRTQSNSSQETSLNELSTTKEKTEDMELTQHDSDIDLDNQKQENDIGLHQKFGQLATSSPRTLIVNPHSVIVCEWSDEAIQEVFSEDKLIHWEKPAELKNSQLEEERQKRQQQEERRITLHDCLKLFSKREVLGLNDSWYCPTCKEHRQATKQIQLWNTPDILLIHLKRFENLRSFSDKIDEVVDFPINGLDMSQYLVNKGDPEGNIYDLVAVDNHYGGLGGGHYTAYVKNVSDGKWYYFDDSRVTETSPEQRVASSAYLLFYIRRTKDGKIGNNQLQGIITKGREQHILSVQEMHARQRLIYDTNKTDSEEEVENEDAGGLEEDNSEDKRDNSEPNAESGGSHENSISARSTDYSVKSLEVGRLQPSESFDGSENNMSRRKLRLLNKTYTESNIAHSPASSISSDGGDSIGASVSRSKSKDDTLLRSPSKN